ncbi:MAG: GNAT family N-acetyltransferase [Bacteroidetes bacterium]|nr:GNAT family N-acetyltransferase [Bacteroidota bacterium]HET6243535.1 GNAT family N-acetyltransferase [Bacteroidia bacterium]
MSIKIIDDSNDPLLIQVKHLFQQMYDQLNDQMPEKQLKIPLVDNGAELWLEGVKKMLGRLGRIVVAIKDDKVIAFANGVIYFTPDYLGDLKVGSIANVFVLPQARELGLGLRLVTELEQWFKSKNVHSVNLQVIFENNQASDFWKHCKYLEEIIQFRKIFA